MPHGNNNYIAKFCPISLEPDQSTGGEEGRGPDVRDEFGTHALFLSSPTNGPKKVSSGNNV